MPILDFKNIPQANGSDKPDTFELFARDFLAYLGYTILENPSRGADGGKDLIIQETREGISGNTYIKWLVSCKHYAFSDKSVSPNDEQNISDRIEQHKCDGFIGFYSTLASSGLMERFKGLRHPYQVFDASLIESKLIGDLKGELLSKRYFKDSMSLFLRDNPKPVKIFEDKLELHCEYCKKELLNEINSKKANLVIYYDYNSISNSKKIIKISPCCKGECDRHLTKHMDLYLSNYFDLNELKSPVSYLNHLMRFINSLNDEKITYTTESVNQLKNLYILLFPFICRELNHLDKEITSRLLHLKSM